MTTFFINITIWFQIEYKYNALLFFFNFYRKMYLTKIEIRHFLGFKYLLHRSTHIILNNYNKIYGKIINKSNKSLKFI